MKRHLKRLLAALAGNARTQRLLEWNAALTRYLMGIGAGAGPESSGEGAVVRRLRRLHATTGQALCVFDVGANRGQFLRVVATGLRDVPFHIHAFEPGRHTFALLSARTGGLANVSANPFGLGREAGERELFYDRPGSGLASLSRRSLDHLGIRFEHSEKVRIETLDGYCRAREVDRIDLLKMDVEGHELDVLEGGARLFRERRVGMATFEFGGCNIDTRTYFRDFWVFFREHGMGTVYRITPSGYLVPIRRYEEAHEQFCTTNFLAVREEGAGAR